MSEQTIVLDCPPGEPRPGDLIDGVIKDTGLMKKNPSHIIMGEGCWDYSEVSPETWKSIQPILKSRITKLYNEGLIRYGSW